MVSTLDWFSHVQLFKPWRSLINLWQQQCVHSTLSQEEINGIQNTKLSCGKYNIFVGVTELRVTNDLARPYSVSRMLILQDLYCWLLVYYLQLMCFSWIPHMTCETNFIFQQLRYRNCSQTEIFTRYNYNHTSDIQQWASFVCVPSVYMTWTWTRFIVINQERGRVLLFAGRVLVLLLFFFICELYFFQMCKKRWN